MSSERHRFWKDAYLWLGYWHRLPNFEDVLNGPTLFASEGVRLLGEGLPGVGAALHVSHTRNMLIE